MKCFKLLFAAGLFVSLTVQAASPKQVLMPPEYKALSSSDLALVCGMQLQDAATAVHTMREHSQTERDKVTAAYLLQSSYWYYRADDKGATLERARYWRKRIDGVTKPQLQYCTMTAFRKLEQLPRDHQDVIVGAALRAFNRLDD